MNCREANDIDMVDYLDSLGCQPTEIRNNDYWYLSPLRSETKPSFKVNRKLNVWYDHGLGEGGNLIRFGMLYHRCGIKELLEKIKNVFSFHPQKETVQQPLPKSQNLQKALEPEIKVIAAKPLTNRILCSYLDDRKIPGEIAKKYCKEINFELHDKKYFAIGFENKSGGFELRNEYFKGSSSPKDVTIFNYPHDNRISVFEGFFSFLSYLTINQNNSEPLSNFLVLNSLSFFEKCRSTMEEYKKIHLYLDRDQAGMKHTQNALNWNIKYIDKSQLYNNHKDLNDYLLNRNLQQKPSQKLRRRL